MNSINDVQTKKMENSQKEKSLVPVQLLKIEFEVLGNYSDHFQEDVHPSVCVIIMNLQWALITLTILAWWSHANAGRLARPDCERFVFHPHCRGTQAKKRVITDPTSINSNIKDSNAERLCICKYLTKSGKRDLLAITKLLETMLANGVDVNMLYDAYSNMGLLSNKDGNDNLRSTHRTNQLSRNSDNVDYNKPDIDLDY